MPKGQFPCKNCPFDAKNGVYTEGDTFYTNKSSNGTCNSSKIAQ